MMGLAQKSGGAYEVSFPAEVTADMSITVNVPSSMSILSVEGGEKTSERSATSTPGEEFTVTYGPKGGMDMNLIIIAVIVVLVLVFLLRKKKPSEARPRRREAPGARGLGGAALGLNERSAEGAPPQRARSAISSGASALGHTTISSRTPTVPEPNRTGSVVSSMGPMSVAWSVASRPST